MRGADYPLSTGPSAPGDHMSTKTQEVCPVLYQKNGHQLLVCWEASLNCHVLKSLASLVMATSALYLPKCQKLSPLGQWLVQPPVLSAETRGPQTALGMAELCSDWNSGLCH
ncbi:hypothetical protein PAL_GLEAN10008221 [Pteropus alecto]|uniref:Uncharacterized protein n=1 Tax=Pteropus alecto TaxID=9402 RepID=L5K0L6_PTEAL|nr:hypothetical protein PAL_GLEAN10008221 [Pteropus alecto]